MASVNSNTNCAIGTRLGLSKYFYILIIIQFSLINCFKYRKWLKLNIWLIDGTLTGSITPGQSSSGSKAMKKYFTFLKDRGLEPLHQM